MTEFSQEAQGLSPSAIISLFTLDTSRVGGPILRFTQSSRVNQPVLFAGIKYDPVDVNFEGLEVSGIGPYPNPKISIANTGGLTQALVNSYGDLNGCPITRIRTFARFLDGSEDADPTAMFGPDMYRVERKIDDNQDFIQWELSSSIDQEGKMIPGRLVIKNTCMWRYRTWNKETGEFDYSGAQCPYAGEQSYDINDQPVASHLDQPSRKVSCCRARFGDQPLPFGGFPGVPLV